MQKRADSMDSKINGIQIHLFLVTFAIWMNFFEIQVSVNASVEYSLSWYQIYQETKWVNWTNVQPFGYIFQLLFSEK